MENKHSSDGIGEDVIRAITNLACSEEHAKTLYEKTGADLENGLIDVENTDELQAKLDKMESLRQDLNTYAGLRRSAMLTLYELYESKGDKDMWCMVKHLAVAVNTLYESYQASDNDLNILQLATDANKAFTKALSQFLGAEITECASCLSDFLKAKDK